MATLTNPFSETTAWSYDATGRAVKVTYGNGAYTTYQYDQADQVTLMQHPKSDQTLIWSLAYAYDGAGNRLQLTESDGSVTNWGYDLAGRLTSDVRTDGLLLDRMNWMA